MAHTSNMSHTARRAANAARDTAEETKGMVQDLADDMMHSAKKVGNQAKEVVQERWEDLRSMAGDCMEQGREKAHEMERQVEERIQERPFVALLMALGFGFLIGMWCRRSR